MPALQLRVDRVRVCAVGLGGHRRAVLAAERQDLVSPSCRQSMNGRPVTAAASQLMPMQQVPA